MAFKDDKIYYTEEKNSIPVDNGKWMPVSIQDFKFYEKDAVVGGHERNKALIYLGRALYDGDILPCKILPTKNEAYLPFGRKEVKLLQFDLCTLPAENIKWRPGSNGRVPDGAVQFGKLKCGEPLYVGRVHYNNALIPGKIQPSHECVYVHPSYGFKELKFEEYDVLCV